MSYPRQDSVTARLQALSLRALSKQAAKMREDSLVLWRRASRLLKADIAVAYSASVAPARDGRWDLIGLEAGGTYHKLAQRAAAVLEDFRQRSRSKVGMSLRDLRSEGARRGRWVISQVTPPSRHFTARLMAREADVPLSAGFETRWDEWVRAYHGSLMQNIRMNAISGGSISDAVAEVDATRVSTPAYTLEAALDRLWDYYSWEAISGGMHQAVDEFGDDIEKEVWRTSGDLRVCDDCDANEGEEIEDADGIIPLHPNCHCFYQIVPASYASLLRSGNQTDRDLAREMDAAGIAPNAMVVRGEKGDIKARVIVDFDEWESAKGSAIRGGV